MDTMSDIKHGNGRFAVAVVPIAAALLLAGCGNGESAPVTETQTETKTETETGTATEIDTVTESEGDATFTLPTDPPGDVCPPGDLIPSIERVEGAAGSQYIHIALNYRGDSQCFLRGFPGVSAVDGAGNQVGEAAGRNEEPAREAMVTPSRPARFTLRLSRVEAESGCKTADAQGLRIYPPGSREALETISHQMKICVDPPTVMLWAGSVMG